MRVRLNWIFAALVVTGIACAAYVVSKPASRGVTGTAPAVPVTASPILQSGSMRSSRIETIETPKQPIADSRQHSPAASTRKVWAEFAMATDYRRFALSAAQHPKSGGISYAIHALGICQVLETILPAYGIEPMNSITYDGKEDPLTFAARAKSLEIARRNCGTFSGSELSGAEGQRYLDLAKSQDDIIFAMQEKFNQSRKSSDVQAKSNAIAEILSSKDPLLLSYTLQRMMLDRNDKGQLGYWLDGTFTPNVAGDAILAAINALPCKYGLVCDTSDLEVMRACLGGNGCFKTRYDYLKSSLSPADQVKSESLQKRLMEIVDNVDATALTRRK